MISFSPPYVSAVYFRQIDSFSVSLAVLLVAICALLVYLIWSAGK